MKRQRTQNSQDNSEKEEFGGFLLPDLERQYTATAIKTM